MPMFDEAYRARLHQMLDGLIDDVEKLQAAFPGPVNALMPRSTPRSPAILSWRESDLVADGMRLLRDLFGERILSDALDRPGTTPSEQREQVSHWLWAMYPLLQRSLFFGRPDRLSAFEVMDALSALEAGEVHPMLLARTGKNRRPNRWTLARRKLEALVWKKRLRALGLQEKAAKHEVTVAFGEQWDTIRKWERQCVNILGESHVTAALGFAAGPRDPYLHGSKGMLGSRPPKDWREGIAQDGNRYREELRKAAELAAGRGAA